MKNQKRAKKMIAAALTAGMLMGTMSTPVAAATEGWKKDATGWWYQNANGSYPKNKWEKINGAWYYFNGSGYMVSNSWIKDADGKWYYLGTTGAMKTNDWVKGKAGEWYFVGADGTMKTNDWAQDKSGKWYYLGADGVMMTDTLLKDKGKSYYLNADGVMATNTWIEDKSGKIYYMGNDGSMIVDDKGNTLLGDISFKMDNSWELLSGASDGVIYTSSTDVNADVGYIFIGLSEEVENGITEKDLLATKSEVLKGYEKNKSIVIDESVIDTACGKALSFTIDATNSYAGTAVSKLYAKQVFFANENKIYGLQIICSSDDFSDAESKFDAIIASVSK